MTAAKEASKTVAKILLVESDQVTRQLLGEHLETDRFEVAPAENVEAARSQLATGTVDLVLLDLKLPDALDLLGEIRQNQRPIGVIVVTGRSTERDRVRAVQDGAADYVQRPYAYGELLARIHKVLRKLSGPDRITRVGELEIDTKTDRVTVAGREVRLTKKELALLKVLVSDPDRVFTREELLRKVYGHNASGHTRTLEATLDRLKTKLDPHTRRYVICCWGVGWKAVWE